MRNIMHDNRDFYRLLFDKGPYPTLIIKEGQFIDCNSATITLLAYANKQAFLKLGPADISPAFQPDGECSKVKAAALIARILSSGFECFDWTLQGSDGELINVQVIATVMVLNNATIIHSEWRNIRAQQQQQQQQLLQQQLLSTNVQLTLEIAELKSTVLAQQNKQLRAINQRYLTSFILAPIGILHLSPNGHFLEVNEGFCQFIGYDYEQLLALDIKQLECPYCLPVFEPLLKTLTATSANITQETCYIHQNGQRIWGRSTLKIIKDAEGQIDYVLQLIEDITQQKADQQQLIYLSQALEQSQNPVVITDLSGNMEYVNASFIANSGYSKEDLLGNNQRLLKSGKTPDSTYQLMFKAMQEGQNWQGEFINHSKLGIEYIVSTHISPIRNDCGEISHYLGVKEDITHRNTLRLALQDSQQFTTSILDSLLSEIAVIDRDGFIVATNQPWRQFGVKNGLGYTYDDWVGINYLNCYSNYNEVYAETSPFILNASNGIKQVQDGKLEVFRLEYPCSIDGTDIWFEMQVKALNTESGEIIIQHTNIDTYKQIEFELAAAKFTAEQATTVKSEFLATMSHEIRTPMNAIIGFSKLALYQDFSPEAQSYFAKINTASTSLLSLLNGILDLSRLAAQSINLEPIAFQLDSMVDSLHMLFIDASSSKGLTLNLTIDEKVPLGLLGDANRLQQILINLLGNAIKFTESGNVSLAISLQQSQQSLVRLVFSVKDTGIGIASEHQHKLFLPFSQVDGSITRLYGGSGLGLAICNELLSLMDSQLSLCSIPNQGSTFSFELNLAVLPLNFISNTDQANSFKLNSNEHNPTLAGYKVLVVEDNIINQQVVTEFLSLSGILVSVANNGKEALELLAQNDFSAVLMDMHMPVMDGFETTQQLRLQPRFKNLPIFALSAGVTAEEQARCLASGINEFISKPITPEQLLTVLTRWIKPVAIPAQRVNVAATALYDDLALFDFKNILALIGNNQALLIDILQTFKDSFHSFPAELNALLLTKDRLAIQAIVHTLKGTAGNMGAVRLHAAVTLFDAELKVSLPNEDRLQSFSQTFIATMASLDNILKS
ncbi:MAG: PAS domain S-box protein [Methylococcaceae bacterium]